MFKSDKDKIGDFVNSPTTSVVSCFSGWLEKKGSFVSSWKKRWFVLTKDKIEYYDAYPPMAENKKGEVFLDAASTVLIRNGGKHLYKFGVCTRSRILECCGSSDSDRIAWMDAIQNQVKLLNSTSDLIVNDTIFSNIKEIGKQILRKDTNMEIDTPMNRRLNVNKSDNTNSNNATANNNNNKNYKISRNKHKLNKPHIVFTDDDVLIDRDNRSRNNTITPNKVNSNHDVSSISAAFDDAHVNEKTDNILKEEHIDTIPIGWEYLKAETGEFYYYHTKSRTSRKNKPSPKVIEEVNLRHAESILKANEAIEKRRIEKDVNTFVENEVAEYSSQLKSVIANEISEWKQPKGEPLPRCLGELLTAIPDIVGPSIAAIDSITKEPLDIHSSPSDIKKAYVKALRLVHPDKISRVEIIPLKYKMIANEVFLEISTQYDRYRQENEL